MTLSSSDITIIVGALQESDWDEATVVIGDVTISVARNGARIDHASITARAVPAPEAPVTAAPAASNPAPAATGAATSVSAAPAGDHVVTAPSIGVFWRAPEPGAAPFVEVGVEVTAERTVGIVEIMKLMNNVAAGVAGVISAVHVENGQAVEFGTPLFSIHTEVG